MALLERTCQRAPSAVENARTFNTLALVIGLLYAIVNPPFAGNDESAELARSRELGAGRLTTLSDATGRRYHMESAAFLHALQTYEPLPMDGNARLDPASIVHDLMTADEVGLASRVEARAAANTPLRHLIQVPVLWLGSMLQLPVIWNLYLARFVNLTCFVLLSSWAVSAAGSLSWAFLALGLMPMTLTRAASASADGVVLALSLLFFASVSRAALRESPFSSRRELLGLLVLFIVLVLCSPTCLTFALALPLVPVEDRRSPLLRCSFLAACLCLAALALWWWAHINGSLVDATGAADPRAQWRWLLAHPLKSSYGWVRSSFKHLDEYLIEAVAVRDQLSSEMRVLGGVVVALYSQLLLMLSWGVLHSARFPHLPRSRFAAWSAATSAAFATAVLFVAFVAKNKVGAMYLHDVQGSSFLPASPALLLALACFGRPSFARWLTLASRPRVLGPILALNALCLLGLVGRYYVPSRIAWPY